MVGAQFLGDLDQTVVDIQADQQAWGLEAGHLQHPHADSPQAGDDYRIAQIDARQFHPVDGAGERLD